MNDKLKKITKDIAIFMAMILVVAAYVAPAKVKASGSYDAGLAFDYQKTIDFTSDADKNTYSSVGMGCTGSDTDGAYYYARVFGYNNNERFDYSHGYEYYFEPGTYNEMLNWVKENGSSTACVRGEGHGIDSYYGTTFTGYWYPDL